MNIIPYPKRVSETFKRKNLDKVIDLPSRPRRNRKSAAIRSLCRETSLRVEQLVYPVFVHSASGSEDIAAMPGCKRLGIEALLAEVEQVAERGLRAVVLFPAIEESLKSKNASEAYNEKGLIPRAIRELKARFPEITVMTDIALDPYSSDGHDGILDESGAILNDESVAVLCKQALAQAYAGADVLAPSDMMDGRIGELRKALDSSGYSDVSLLSYTAKYASAYYGPFRNALDSTPKSGDKKTYQMDPANVREAIREMELDELEGADILMVKPAGPYLDVIQRLRNASTLPLAAYQVSGEYLQIKAAAKSGWLDEKSIVMESLLGIRRAGADIIFTYFAKDVAPWLSQKAF